MRILGKAVVGRGQADRSLASYRLKIEEALGNAPHPGSLNLVLRQPIVLDPQRAIGASDGKRWFWLAQCAATPCLLTRWRGCPLHVVEVVAAVRLRDLEGEAGALQIDVDNDLLLPVPLTNRLFWVLLWAGRQHWFYASDRYLKFRQRLGGKHLEGQAAVAARCRHTGSYVKEVKP